MNRVALISEHASPLACLGGVDSGGQNVYVGQVARHLARLGAPAGWPTTAVAAPPVQPLPRGMSI